MSLVKFHPLTHSCIHSTGTNLSRPGTECTKMNELWFLFDFEITICWKRETGKSVFQYWVIRDMIELCLWKGHEIVTDPLESCPNKGPPA